MSVNQPRILFKSHSFSVHVATTTNSLPAAVVYNHIAYWIEFNVKNPKAYVDDRIWMYQSVADMHEHLPYLTKKQIRTAIDLLVEYGFLEKDCKTNNKFTKTSWYTFPISNYDYVCPVGQIDLPSMEHRLPYRANGLDPQGKSTYTNKDIEEDHKEDTYRGTPLKEAPIEAKKDEKRCTQTASPHRAVASQILFDFDSGKFQNITEDQTARWQETYPSLQVAAELRRMEDWCMANSQKTRSKKRWHQFISGWLSRNNEKAVNKSAYDDFKRPQNSRIQANLPKETLEWYENAF